MSEVIRENQVCKIDLLKVDVEGSELDVLRGIDQEDWGKIRQVIVEVHDIDNRVEKIVSMLKRRGYSTQVAREDWAVAKLMNIFIVYAIARN